MSNVIGFLESVGKDAKLRCAAKEDLELALVSAQVDPEFQAAILDGDHKSLEVFLGVKPVVCCGMAPGKEDDDEGEESPSKEDEITAQSATRCAA
ncbi:MAG: hypothetical protein P4L92_20540 [Rudaea sp.]|nr:hypothetical protein [Rudaea sp.]